MGTGNCIDQRIIQSTINTFTLLDNPYSMILLSKTIIKG